MSKERLEELFQRYYSSRKMDVKETLAIMIVAKYGKHLLEQADRVQELEQKNDRLKQEADFWRVEDREMMRLSHENKLYQEAMQELKEYLESTIPKIPTNEKPLILTKSLEIINRATEGD